jgi:hypothetical protein
VRTKPQVLAQRVVLALGPWLSRALPEIATVLEVMHMTSRSTSRCRTAIRRDGYSIEPLSLKFCPHEWINSRGYVDRDLAQDAPRETAILPHGAGGL